MHRPAPRQGTRFASRWRHAMCLDHAASHASLATALPARAGITPHYGGQRGASRRMRLTRRTIVHHIAYAVPPRQRAGIGEPHRSPHFERRERGAPAKRLLAHTSNTHKVRRPARPAAARGRRETSRRGRARRAAPDALSSAVWSYSSQCSCTCTHQGHKERPNAEQGRTASTAPPLGLLSFPVLGRARERVR